MTTASATTDLLMTVAPKAPSATVSALLAGDVLNKAMAEFGITTPQRVAAFLAQIAHETGQFQWLEELWGPTPQQRKYEPPSKLAKQLGNTAKGDGKRYKGRGPIQITGRANYRKYGAKLGLPLEDKPELAAQPAHGARIAACYWRDHGLNELADANTLAAFQQITKGINGGLNGLADRVDRWEAAKQFFGIEAPNGADEIS